MPQYESGANSYLRAVREVTPDSVSLDDFLEEAKLAARAYFGSRVKKLPVPATLAEQLASSSIKYEGVELTHARVFVINSLRATLFERRAPASDDVNDILNDANNRFTSRRIRASRYRRTLTGRRQPTYRPNPLPGKLQRIQQAAGFDEGEMPVVASSIVRSVQPEHPAGVTEYSLRIDERTPAAMVISDQHEEIRKHLWLAPAGKPLFRKDLGFEEEGDVLDIPFIVVPNGSPDEHEKFIDAMNTREPVAFTLREVQWNLTTR